MSQNVTNGHKFCVTGTIFKTSVFQTYPSCKYIYDHGLRVINLICIGIDPPGRTSQSKFLLYICHPVATYVGRLRSSGHASNVG